MLKWDPKTKRGEVGVGATVRILDFEDAQLKEMKTAGLANFCRFLELWLSAF